jgi:hypothetical protein
MKDKRQWDTFTLTIKVKIVKADGQVVPLGEAGELCARSYCAV